MTPDQKTALKQALDQHSFRMSIKDAAPEDVAQLPEDFQVPSYSANTSPLYENQLFPKITSADDLINLGYATPEGVPTESGKMAIALKKAGSLNDDYTLNDTGKVMMASQEDILKEENIDLYREYKRLELDEAPDVGIWDMAKGIAADLVKGANAIAENELGGIKDIASSQAFGGAFEPYGAEPLTPEKKAESRIKTEEAAKDLFVSSAGLARAAATEIDKVAAKTMWDGMMQDYQVSYLEQKYDRDLADMEKVNTAEVADELAKVIGLSTQFAEGRQQAEELLGPEATQKAIEEGRAAGLALSVVNPLAPEALVARAAFGVARKGVSAAFKPISRKLLESEAKAAQALQASQRVTGLQGNLAQVNYLAQKAEQEAIFAERQADKYSKLGLSNRANDARTFADKLRTRGLEAGAKVQGLTDEIARASEEASKLAQDAAVADKINFIAQKAREIPGLPIQAIGGLVEGTGMAMIGIDKGLSKLASKIGADKAYNAMNKITTLSGVGTLASAAGLGPAAFIPAAIKTAWSTAPFLKGAGHFVRMIGKETANARELIPFWQRVANYETLGATQRSIAHLMDTSTLGSRVTGLAGDVAKGVAASYPIDLAFEWISEGGEMDMNTLKQAAAETVVFGGGGALGGITAGSKERIKKLQRGSALNFYRNIKDGGQRVAFNALNDGMKRSVGTYASAFPNLNIRFTDQGGGAFDPASNTAFINPMSRNPLKPLLAHEINHYILIRNQMEGGISAALVGDGVQTGGLLRGKDGTLDENFLAFKEEYTRRLEAQHNRQINQKTAAGEKIPAKKRQFIAPTDNDIAIEYFVDSMADDMMEMAETGELGKQAGRMLVNRKMQAFGNAILQKAPIIKDFFYKLGGVTDQNGRAVYGNGLLAEGIREIPQMKKLFRQMISESAGRPMHVAKVTKGESEGHTIPITGKNDPILDEMTSMYESDQDGVHLRDKNGDRIPLSDETERLRASSGLLLLEDQENRLKRGETLEPGELRFNPEENAWTGEYLTDRQLQILRASGRFNNVQLKQLELLNGAAEENTGRRFLVFNQPATGKRKGKRLDYETLGISMREIVPYGIKITKDGNILVRLMSVQQLHANAFEKAASKRGQSLYRGDVEAILRDVNQVIENHGRNEPTDAYFKKEYGTEWEVRKNFINTVFGNVGKGQKDINPLLAAEKAKNAVVKTYRIDRINKATELEGRTKLPYQNHLVKVNFMPEGEPILDANGEPKDLRYTPRAEDRMPEQRQMPEAQKSVASRENQVQEGQVNERQPTTIQTQSSGTSVGGPETTGEGLRQQGGLPRGTEQLQPQGRPSDQGIPLTGLPATVTVPGIGKYTFGPNETARNIAAEYARSAGIDYNPPSAYAKVDTERAKRIADEYEKMVHNPNDPKVKESYDAMIKETLDQWEAIKRTGLKVEPIPAGSPDPYAASPRLAIIDVKDNNHLWFFPTENGFGGTESAQVDISGNPLMQPTGEVLNGHVMLANDVFRIVHDYFGHIKEGVGFRADGEENAWRSHSAMYSDKARPAMTAETRGQNSWVNFGPFAEFNKTAKGADTQYAPQKTGLLPDWVMREGASDKRLMPEKLDADYMKAVESGDVEAQQRIVDEAAKAAGYDTPALHGSSADKKFTVFDTSTSPYGRVQGSYFTKNLRGTWDGWLKSRVPMRVYLRFNNPATEQTLKEMGYRLSGVEARKWLTDRGFDGVIDDSMDEVVAFNPNQIKSADPITRDDSGNIIPPSKRFDITSKDLRFMPEKDSGAVDLMSQTSLNGDPFMIMSAKWGTPKQTSQTVSQSSKPENHIVGLSRIKGLMSAKDLTPKQKASLDDFLVKTASFATDSPGFRDLGTPQTKEEALTVIAKVVDRMARNLLAIYDAVPPPIRSYWQRWYPLAYNWNQEQAKNYSITRQVVAGINARLSPGKDWIHNVNMTERILKAFSDDVVMTKEIEDGAMPIIDSALETKLNTRENKNKPKEWVAEQKEKAKAAKLGLQKMIGLKLSQMTDAQAAQLIRYYTQVVGDNRVLNYFEQGTPVYADSISWQSFSNLEKAINMYRNPSMKNISENMGSDHKIRSFFNNQESPNDPVLRDVTSDTHAVAAAYLLPLSQSSQQVSRNFGGASNAVSGLNGMYYIVADAYRKAADARGVEPRAMQSITWEGARSMFPRGFKKAENVKKVESIWNRFERKEITKSQALQEINQLLIDFFAKNPNSRPRFAVLPRQ